MSEPEMVERVAKAICRSTGRDPDRACSTPFAGRKALEWEWFSETARAAIEAMRDPAGGVIAAVEDKAEERYNAAPQMLRWYGSDVWNAGIDAALTEPTAPR